MTVKITDLELFTRDFIFNPYAGTLLECFKKDPILLEVINILGSDKCSLELLLEDSMDKVPELAKRFPDWWKLVKDRIDRIGVEFPSYIDHPIVDLVTM